MHRTWASTTSGACEGADSDLGVEGGSEAASSPAGFAYTGGPLKSGMDASGAGSGFLDFTPTAQTILVWLALELLDHLLIPLLV